METKNPGLNIPPTNYINGDTKYKLDREYNEDIPLSVPKNGEMLTQLKFNSWSKTSEDSEIENLKYWNCFRINKYSEGANVTINNMYNESVKYAIRATSNGNICLPSQQEGLIHPGERFTVRIDCLLYPKDVVRVFFYKL